MDYKTENEKFAEYKEKVNESLMGKEEAMARTANIEAWALEGIHPLVLDSGETHPYLYTK